MVHLPSLPDINLLHYLGLVLDKIRGRLGPGNCRVEQASTDYSPGVGRNCKVRKLRQRQPCGQRGRCRQPRHPKPLGATGLFK